MGWQFRAAGLEQKTELYFLYSYVRKTLYDYQTILIIEIKIKIQKEKLRKIK
jgi:hypothetical protein